MESGLILYYLQNLTVIDPKDLRNPVYCTTFKIINLSWIDKCFFNKIQTNHQMIMSDGKVKKFLLSSSAFFSIGCFIILHIAYRNLYLLRIDQKTQSRCCISYNWWSAIHENNRFSFVIFNLYRSQHRCRMITFFAMCGSLRVFSSSFHRIFNLCNW